MSTIEIIHFAARVRIGSEIEGSRGMVMVVESITEVGFKGYSKYAFDKFGKKSTMYLSYETLLNPHYNQELKIIN